MAYTRSRPDTSSTTHTLPQQDLAFPLNSIILVTGATGFIASHIIRQALSLGFRVRGTVRSEEKAATTKKTHGNHPRYSTAVVPDVSVPGAFKDAIKDISGVIHVASDTSLGGEPERVITAVKAATLEVLKAAAAEPSVKRVVLTSSSSAATYPKPGVRFHIDANSWNDEAVRLAWETPEADRDAAYGFTVYAASKTEGERAAWNFVCEQRPGFVLNAVLPNFNIGVVLPEVNPGQTGSGPIKAYHGQVDEFFPPQYVVNVTDDARVHVAALIDRTVKDERLFAFAYPFNWNDILEAIRSVRPQAKVIENLKGLQKDESTVDNEKCVELMAKWFGQDDWTSIEESVRQNLEHVE